MQGVENFTVRQVPEVVLVLHAHPAEQVREVLRLRALSGRVHENQAGGRVLRRLPALLLARGVRCIVAGVGFARFVLFGLQRHFVRLQIRLIYFTGLPHFLFSALPFQAAVEAVDPARQFFEFIFKTFLFFDSIQLDFFECNNLVFNDCISGCVQRAFQTSSAWCAERGRSFPSRKLMTLQTKGILSYLSLRQRQRPRSRFTFLMARRYFEQNLFLTELSVLVQRSTYRPGRRRAIQAQRLPSSQCRARRALSSRWLHCWRLMEGSRWFRKRSLHTFGVLFRILNYWARILQIRDQLCTPRLTCSSIRALSSCNTAIVPPDANFLSFSFAYWLIIIYYRSNLPAQIQPPKCSKLSIRENHNWRESAPPAAQGRSKEFKKRGFELIIFITWSLKSYWNIGLDWIDGQFLKIGSCSRCLPRYLFLSMILEHPINRREIGSKPTIKFSYTTPSALPRVLSLADYRSLLPLRLPPPTTHPHAEIPPLKSHSPAGRPQSQRKKIFDRTYTTKGSFRGRSGGEVAGLRAKSSTGKLNKSGKKQRRAIFSKATKAAGAASRDGDRHFDAQPFHQRSNQSSIIKLKPPSSLTSYIDIDALRREARQGYEMSLLSKEYEDPFWMERGDQSNSDRYVSSEVKVDISEDGSDAIRSIKCSRLPAEATHERFFDRETAHQQPQKHQKLSEVNLYSTTVDGSFGRTAPPHGASLFESVKRLLDSQLRQNLLAYLLILMGVFLLLVQASK